jgi:hypothetical protein
MRLAFGNDQQEGLMPLTGSCHCGAVRLSVPGAPAWLGSCNCSFCRRIGSLMAYYPDDGSVGIEGETVPYVWGDRMISLHHCPTCGCFTDWRSTGESHGKVGVNARLLDGFALSEGRPLIDGREIEVRFFDNAD